MYHDIDVYYTRRPGRMCPIIILVLIIIMETSKSTISNYQRQLKYILASGLPLPDSYHRTNVSIIEEIAK